MSTFVNFYKLIRGTNILIIALSMTFFRYFEITKMFDMVRKTPTLDTFHFALLCIAVMLIAAGGNVVNDYLDFANDKQFKPEKTVLGEWISLDEAFNLQATFSGLGIAIGYYLAWKINYWQLGNIFAIAAVLLWVYSVSLKKWFLVGNIVVALLSGVVFMLVVLFEPQLWDTSISPELKLFYSPILIKAQAYAIFAFWLSLIREIVKDAEDKMADTARTMKTLPILFSIKMTNLVLVIMIFLLMAGLISLCYYFYELELKNQFWYILLTLVVTLLLNSISVMIAKAKEDYHNISTFLKLNMLFGVFSMPIFYYTNLYFPL
jgi:4-hydroxybenzoate polyprenyltransferase